MHQYLTYNQMLEQFPEFEIFQGLREGRWPLINKLTGRPAGCPFRLTTMGRLVEHLATMALHGNEEEQRQLVTLQVQYDLNYPESNAWYTLRADLTPELAQMLADHLSNVLFSLTGETSTTTKPERQSNIDRFAVMEQARVEIEKTKGTLTLVDLSGLLQQRDPGCNYSIRQVIEWIRPVCPGYTPGRPGRKSKK